MWARRELGPRIDPNPRCVKERSAHWRTTCLAGRRRRKLAGGMRRDEEAGAQLVRLLAIREGGLSPDHPELAVTLENDATLKNGRRKDFGVS